MTTVAKEMLSEHDQFKNFTSAAELGLWGLALKALDAGEGPGAGAALLASVKAGRGTVEFTTRIDAVGVVHEGHFCSHGSRSHLFSVRVTYPEAGAAVKGAH